MQRLERLLDRRLVVPAMRLVEIDVIRAEPFQAGVDLVHDRLSRQALAVRVVAHLAVHLGGDHHLLAPGKVLQRAAGDLLAGAERIDVRRVEEVDAGLERLLEERPARLLVERPAMRAALDRAVGHAAKADARDFEAGPPEIDIIHDASPVIE